MKWKIEPNWRPEDGAGSEPPAAVDPPVAEPAPADPPAPEPSGGTPWFMHRINALTAQKKGADEKLAAAEAELARLRAIPASPGGPSEEEIEKRVMTRAEKLAQEKAVKIATEQVFNSRLGQMGDQGRKELGVQEFNGALQTFQTSFGNLPNEFLEACLESGAGHRVIFELSKDLDRAASIMTLPSVAKMAVEVAKLAADLDTSSKKKVTPPTGGRTISAAPPPIEPRIGGGNSGGDPLTKPQSTRDWIAARESQLKAGRR